MKHLLLVIAVGFLTINAVAENLPKNVIAEQATYVGFAPPEYVGTFKFQILASGVVQTIDNKNKKVELAILSKDVVAKLVDAIDSIKNNKLSEPQDPPCMDAPSQHVVVQQSNGTNLTIFVRSGCRDSESSNRAAVNTARMVNSLETSFSIVNYIKD